MKYISILFFALTMIACKSKQSMTTTDTDTSTLSPLLELTKTPCFGTCPSFTLKVYQNGLAVLDGKKYVKHIGLSHMMLSEKQLNLLTDRCNKAQLFSLKSDYNERVMDLPTTSLTYHSDGDVKKISGNMNFPDGFNDVVKTCMKIVEMDGWELKEAYNVK